MELLEELVEEILLHITHDEPAYLIRASLVCRSWLRILSDRNFLGRYRVFHRTPPLLGYFHNLYSRPGPIPRFVKTSTAPLSSEPVLLGGGGSSCWWALDCRHGRVLTRTFEPDDRLVVWDPVTGDQQHLSVPTCLGDHLYTGAILCAAMDDGCDHLNCHGRPFVVVFVGASVDYDIRASVYSSETHVWGASTSVHSDRHHTIDDGNQSLLVGGMLHFTLSGCKSILKYDFGAHRLSLIDANLPVMDTRTPGVLFDNMAIAKAEDGGLGLITVLGNCVYFWMQQAAAGTANGSPRTRWVQHRVININTLPPKHYRSYSRRQVIGFAEDNDIIFINRDDGVFMLDLKSMHARKIGERERYSAMHITLCELLHSRWDRLVQRLEGMGYRDGETLHAAPYDFRYAVAPPGHPSAVGDRYFRDLGRLIQASRLSHGRPAVVVAHSFGCALTYQLLLSRPPAWRRRYVARVVLLGPALGWFAAGMRVLTAGMDFGLPGVTRPAMLRLARSQQSALWRLPTPLVFGDRPLAVTATATYTARNVSEFLGAIGFADGVRPYLTRVLPMWEALPPPMVPVASFIGSGVSTPETYVFGADGLEGDAEVLYGDGDGDINMVSLAAVEKWSEVEGQVLKVVRLPGVRHDGFFSDDFAVKSVLAEISEAAESIEQIGVVSCGQKMQ